MIKKSHIITTIAMAVVLTAMASCRDSGEKTALDRYRTEAPRLANAADSASFLYGVANGEGFITAVIKQNTGNLMSVNFENFFNGLSTTLDADSATFDTLAAQTVNIDALVLPQPELSRRYGILAGMSARSFKAYYDIAWDNDKIAEGYYHGMVHDRADVLPGPLAQEELRAILFRIAAPVDSIQNSSK